MSPTKNVVEGSDNVKVNVSVWPVLSVPDPERVSDTDGYVVSVVRLRIELHEVLTVPAMSVKAVGPMHSDALPLLILAVGVNVAV